MSFHTGITTIEEYTFNVNFLTHVQLPAGLKTIAASTFRDNRLISVDFPTSLTSIEANAFLANRLININLPAGLTYIGENTFKINSDLASFVLPKNSADGKLVQWQESNGTVLDSEYTILPAKFGYSYRVIIPD